MRPIWFFVGILLVVFGVLILGAGLLAAVSGDMPTTILASTHPRIWWGAIMLTAGILFLVFNRKSVA